MLGRRPVGVRIQLVQPVEEGLDQLHVLLAHHRLGGLCHLGTLRRRQGINKRRDHWRGSRASFQKKRKSRLL
jgi:hypothetical protein